MIDILEKCLAFIKFLIEYLKFLFKIYKLKVFSPDHCYPIIGHAHYVIGLNEEDRLTAIGQLFQSFDRIAKIWFGPIPVIGVVHPDLVQKIFLADDIMEKSRYFYGIFGVDESLIATKYAKWKTERKIFNLSFSSNMLRNFIPLLANCAEDLVKDLLKYSDGSPFDLLTCVSKCTLDILISSVYGFKKSADERIYEESIKAAHTIHTGISARFSNPIIRPLSIYKLTKLYRKDQEARNLAFGHQEMLYRKRKAMILEDHGAQKSIMDQMIMNEDKFTESAIRDNIHLFLLAGFETTGNQVSFAILMMALHPEMQEKLYREIKELFTTEGVEFTMENLNKLNYLDQVIKETMRLFPVAQFLVKTTSTEFELDGHIFPKGTTLMISLRNLHRRKDFWGESSDQFNPDNFSPEKVAGRHPYSFIPFSSGKRNCLGFKFATLSMKLILLKILLNFKLSTNLKYDELRFFSQISLQLSTPYNIKITKRIQKD